MTVENVRFRDAVLLQGVTTTNCKAGWHNCTMKIDKGGVEISVPAQGDAKAFATLIPFSNIKQIEFKPV